MVDIALGARVPYVSQLNFGKPKDPRSEETGCWFASVSMVGFFFEKGPRLGVPSLYTINKTTAKGVQYVAPTKMNKYDELAINENLEPIPHPANPPGWTCLALADLLRAHGPLLVRRAPWRKNKLDFSSCHVIVLVGARESDQRVVCHDPGQNGAYWKCKIDFFNQMFKWNGIYSQYSLMYKHPPNYPPPPRPPRPPTTTATGATRGVAQLAKAFGGSKFP